MNKKIVSLFLIILTLSMTSSVYAQQKEGHKLERGVIQISTSIVDIPRAICDETTARGNPITGIPVGFLKGMGNVFAHVFSGIFNIVTCPFPNPEMNADMFPESSQEVQTQVK